MSSWGERTWSVARTLPSLQDAYHDQVVKVFFCWSYSVDQCNNSIKYGIDPSLLAIGRKVKMIKQNKTTSVSSSIVELEI